MFMQRIVGGVAILALALAGLSAAAQVKGQDKQATPAEQYQALLKEFQGAAATYFQSTNEVERQTIVARVDQATVRLLELVEKNPREPFSLEALTHIVT